jgi:hypothetical protein
VICPLSHLLELVRFARADRRFAPGDPDWHAFLEIAGKLRSLPGASQDDPADTLASAALDAALELIGQGEEGGNNQGAFVAMLLEPAKPPANWCAAFAGFCYQRAAARLGIALPFRRSLGAKRLGKNVGAVGRIFTDPALARPGDLMVFDRGTKGSWMGHVAMVERACDHDEHGGHAWVDVIEGNSGPRVRRSTRYPTSAAERFAFFASLRRG